MKRVKIITPIVLFSLLIITSCKESKNPILVQKTEGANGLSAFGAKENGDSIGIWYFYKDSVLQSTKLYSPQSQLLMYIEYDSNRFAKRIIEYTKGRHFRTTVMENNKLKSLVLDTEKGHEEYEFDSEGKLEKQ